ncbi:hypothetical protein EV684_1083 [Rubrivivax gelatinosus]|uniref:Uncharacterized protein n=1 Tax=Rubrivivax gelatinosus TaxID=28068 RepID=A0A4R2MBB6_RUBGE|nr:hypothetical protein EV684_1083 [Rubrivivax gelatinosus]
MQTMQQLHLSSAWADQRWRGKHFQTVSTVMSISFRGQRFNRSVNGEQNCYAVWFPPLRFGDRYV